MILVADSGSTKTAWWVGPLDAQSPEEGRMLTTVGVNPFQMTVADMQQVFYQLKSQVSSVESISFYGAGCTEQKAPIVKSALENVFGIETSVRVFSDMLGAAHAVCGSDEGVVCILGTGSNSCLYDGHEICANVSPLGYILGDEGGGAYIGKRLVGNCLKRQFPVDLCDSFLQETGLTPADIIQRTYREPQPNRFLASLSPFCHRHRDRVEIQDFLFDCFSEFFVRNVLLYGRPDLPVHFVGSIAWQYEDELKRAAQRCGLRVGQIVKDPLSGMVRHVLHSDKNSVCK